MKKKAREEIFQTENQALQIIRYKKQIEILERTIKAMRNSYASKTLSSQMETFNSISDMHYTSTKQQQTQTSKAIASAEKELQNLWATPRIIDICPKNAEKNPTLAPILYRTFQLKKLAGQIQTLAASANNTINDTSNTAVSPTVQMSMDTNV